MTAACRSTSYRKYEFYSVDGDDNAVFNISFCSMNYITAQFSECRSVDIKVVSEFLLTWWWNSYIPSSWAYGEPAYFIFNLTKMILYSENVISLGWRECERDWELGPELWMCTVNHWTVYNLRTTRGNQWKRQTFSKKF